MGLSGTFADVWLMFLWQIGNKKKINLLKSSRFAKAEYEPYANYTSPMDFFSTTLDPFDGGFSQGQKHHPIPT